MGNLCFGFVPYRIGGFGSNISHCLFVGWVEHPDIFCWVSFLYPTYLPAIFVLSAKPNKMAEDRTIPGLCNISAKLIWRRGTVEALLKQTCTAKFKLWIFINRLGVMGSGPYHLSIRKALISGFQSMAARTSYPSFSNVSLMAAVLHTPSLKK